MDRYSAWCREHFELMADGGTWAVPRSGLIFEKRGDRLELVERMPFTPDMAAAAYAGKDVPKTPRELREYQDADFELIRQHFDEAGITIVAKVD